MVEYALYLVRPISQQSLHRYPVCVEASSAEKGKQAGDPPLTGTTPARAQMWTEAAGQELSPGGLVLARLVSSAQGQATWAGLLGSRVGQFLSCCFY